MSHKENLGMEKLTRLFEPGRIGKLEIKNRIISAPLGMGFNFGTKPNGFVTDKLIAYNEARAKGGVGMIQLNTSAVARPYASSLLFGPGVLGLRTAEHIPGAQKMTKAIHAHGTKISFSLGFIGAIMARMIARKPPPPEYPEFSRVITATGRRDPFTGIITHTMEIEEIEKITEAFGQAAIRGKEANFDAVWIHGGHGYLIHQFLSPRTNHRTDQYGGSRENRARFTVDLIKRVRKAVEPDFPIYIRMNGDDHLDGGITVEDAKEYAKMFVAAGVDALDISCGPFETHQWQFPNMYMPYGTLLPLAAAIKEVVSVPVIAVGRLDVFTAEIALRDGAADFAMFGRPLMADPDMPNKAMEGRFDEIRHCIFCGFCQAAREAGSPASCTVNMGMGKELEYKLEPPSRKKKVMVIGGGPAGAEAACTLAERGHEVSLYEKSDKLGGQWAILSSFLPEEGRLIKYQAHRLKKFGVKVHMNRAVTAQMVRDIKPDAVVVATGSISATLDVPGIDNRNVVQANDVLTGKVETGQKVVVVGGRGLGCDVALFLAEKGKDVSIITRSKVGRDMLHNLKQTMLEFLVKARVHMYEFTVPDSITEKGLNCWFNSGDSKERDDLFFFLPADTVVLAVGVSSDYALGEEITGIIPETYLIGDCSGKRTVFDAMHDGSDIGSKI
jgi:2,4-dienoyl-CoA reductase-like NADH-dependent reductase (Old Yellow Enzyme family)/thioredoxin reductase